MPFSIALSGLNAASTDLEVTGNNIANSATNGFKESRAEFADLYASAIQDTGQRVRPGCPGRQIAQQFSQGSIDFTSNNLDLAISGQGFFVLEATDGTQAYTRAGAYSVDREGFVINDANDRLQVYERRHRRREVRPPSTPVCCRICSCRPRRARPMPRRSSASAQPELVAGGTGQPVRRHQPGKLQRLDLDHGLRLSGQRAHLNHVFPQDRHSQYLGPVHCTGSSPTAVGRRHST